MSRRSLTAVLLIALLATGFGVSATISRAQSGETVREVLVAGQPAAAPGQVLQLQRVTIPPQTELPVHIHPGMQAAWIAEGVLTYHVVDGEAIVTRAPVDGTPVPSETLTDGAMTQLQPGDSVVETEGLVHYAANETDSVIVIFIASLLASDQSGTIVVDGMATPAA